MLNTESYNELYLGTGNLAETWYPYTTPQANT